MTRPDDSQKENHTPQLGETGAGSRRASAEAVPERQTIESIVTEGDDERWLLARRTALEVFRTPALVTPRCMALLGEQGIAAFVDEVRSLAKGFIQRERDRLVSSSASGSNSADPATKRPAADAPLQPRNFRKPASLSLAQFEAPSMTEMLKLRLQMSDSTKAFISDALFGSIIAAVAIALGLFALHFSLSVN
jgi:hypothetical protein